MLAPDAKALDKVWNVWQSETVQLITENVKDRFEKVLQYWQQALIKLVC